MKENMSGSKSSQCISLPYGNSYLEIRLVDSNIACILERQFIPELEDEFGTIINSLRLPIASAPLLERIHNGDKIVIIVTDNTRPCPDDRLLPPIIAELEKKVGRKDITIIVGLGLHPPLDRSMLEVKLGKHIVDNYHVLNHNVNKTRNIGYTTYGTPVDINEIVLDADFRLSTGFIEPHFFAGFSGGRKSIAPGVSSFRTIYHNHGYKMIDNPRARAGVLEGNPVHEDMVEQAKLAGLDFIVNVLLNKEKRITHVVSGDPVMAHEAGCEIARNIAGVKINQKFDIVITTNSGAPLDLNLYQTCKGIDTASQITRDGGIILVAAACNTGVGPKHFYNLHASCLTPKEVLQRIRREEPVGVQWQNQILARAQLGHDIYLVSDLNARTVRKMMLTPASTIEEVIYRARTVLGKKAEIAVIPEGPLVLPLLE
jgi:nickel-dependent lactate racemase